MLKTGMIIAERYEIVEIKSVPAEWRTYIRQWTIN